MIYDQKKEKKIYRPGARIQSKLFLLLINIIFQKKIKNIHRYI